MRTHRTARLCAAILVAIGATTGLSAQQPAPAAAHDHPMAMPTTGYRAELLADLATLEERYLGLAGAMAGKYEWKPGEGVRSTGAVFMHVAAANLMIPSMIGIEPPSAYAVADMRAAFARMQEMEKVTDRDQIRTTLQQSFAHVRHAIASVPDDQLEAPIKLFGRDSNKRGVLHLLVTHMHEHLGQSIAYARTNGVVPPWSARGGI